IARKGTKEERPKPHEAKEAEAAERPFSQEREQREDGHEGQGDDGQIEPSPLLHRRHGSPSLPMMTKASSRRMPPSVSLVSTNGPSVTSTLPSFILNVTALRAESTKRGRRAELSLPGLRAL